MCHAVTCRRCGKTTWAGCGRHVPAVKASVPAGRWCGGHDDGPGRKSLFSRRR